MSEQPTELLQGTLDLLILNTLRLTPLHGLGISRRLEEVTEGAFLVKPGSLFPALHRMEEAGWISSEWGETATGRRAKFYRLLRAGRRQLEKETERWGRASLAVNRALGAEG
jgi:PadR family transcriptional regulator, regulatory protein PadR